MWTVIKSVFAILAFNLFMFWGIFGFVGSGKDAESIASVLFEMMHACIVGLIICWILEAVAKGFLDR